MSEEVQSAPDLPPEDSAPAPETVAEPPPLPSLGELMIAARERWNLSAGDVARQLRLGLSQVEALEANRFDALPGNTFVRGFIRNYAKVVQVDPAGFLEAYERSRPQIKPPEISAHTERIDFTAKPVPKWVWYVSGTLVALLLLPVLIYFALDDDGAAPPSVAQGVPQAAATKAVPVQPGQAIELALPLPPPQVVSDGVAPPLPDAAQPGVLAPPAALASTEKPAPAASGPVIKIKFEGDAWVEVQDKTGNKIFSQLNRAGSEETVQGVPPFSLVVGDARKVRITYNGKPVDLTPHVKKTVARLTLE